MKQQRVKIQDINRPHQSVIDDDKDEYLMESISEIGLQQPIDLLEVDGKLYGFNGCHRYTAHKRLGLEFSTRATSLAVLLPKTQIQDI